MVRENLPRFIQSSKRNFVKVSGAKKLRLVFLFGVVMRLCTVREWRISIAFKPPLCNTQSHSCQMTHYIRMFSIDSLLLIFFGECVGIRWRIIWKECNRSSLVYLLRRLVLVTCCFMASSSAHQSVFITLIINIWPYSRQAQDNKCFSSRASFEVLSSLVKSF